MAFSTSQPESVRVVGGRSPGGQLRTARVTMAPLARPTPPAPCRGARAPPRSIHPAPTIVAPAGGNRPTRIRRDANS
ncbi:unnamed protein product, partial [Iphiclides podalirius]